MRVFSIILMLISIFPKPMSITTTPKVWYARIMDENVCFYKSPLNNTTSNIYFILESSYFVKLIDEAGADFYKAEYRDLVGYVKKNEVKTIKSTPNTPYLENVNFRVYSPISQYMRSSPSINDGSSSQVYFLPNYSMDSDYYGKIYGESAIIDRTNVWYFCKYTADKEYFGYIYSDGVDKLTNFPKNNEICEYVAAPDFSMTESVATTKSPILVNSKKFRYLILIVSIPVAIFIFMILKSNIILKLQKKERANEIKPFVDSKE